MVSETKFSNWLTKTKLEQNQGEEPFLHKPFLIITSPNEHTPPPSPSHSFRFVGLPITQTLAHVLIELSFTLTYTLDTFLHRFYICNRHNPHPNFTFKLTQLGNSIQLNSTPTKLD